MSKRKYYLTILTLAAFLTVAGAGIKEAWAYFTTFSEAAGGYTIHLGDRTEFTEEFSNQTKHVVITSDADSEPVYVRARAFSGSKYPLTYSGEGWSLGADDYYYYQSILEGGASTSGLDIRIDGIPVNGEEAEKNYFNVVVIYESTPVKYHEDGSAYTIQETDWTELLDSGSTTGTNQPETTEQAEGGGES